MHAGSVAAFEDEIIAAGAQIIWVLEQEGFGNPGTAMQCRDYMASKGSTAGWCVGDAQTQPIPITFDNSPFSVGRGFDMIVVRETMEVAFTSAHGTTGGENYTGEEILGFVEQVVMSLP